MSRSPFPLVACALLCAPFAFGCVVHKYGKRTTRSAPTYQGDDASNAPPPPRSEPARKGVASVETWLDVRGFGARVRVPSGWEWTQQGLLVTAQDASGRGAFVFVGAENDAQLKKKLELSFQLLGIVPGPSEGEPRKTELGGVTYLRQDYLRARVNGQPAHAIAVVGPSSVRGGYVIFVGHSLSGNEDMEEQLRDAANSLSRG